MFVILKKKYFFFFCFWLKISQSKYKQFAFIVSTCNYAEMTNDQFTRLFKDKKSFLLNRYYAYMLAKKDVRISFFVNYFCFDYKEFLVLIAFFVLF